MRLIAENEARRRDIRPMQVALLNLMPGSPRRRPSSRGSSAPPLQVELTLLTTSTYRPNTVPLSHLQSFYQTWDEVRNGVRRADHHRRAGRDAAVRGGQVLAGADPDHRLVADPRPHLVPHLLGRAGRLHHFHGVPKRTLPPKRFGVFTHTSSSAPTPRGRRSCAVSTTTPGPGLAPHRGARGGPARGWRARDPGCPPAQRVCASCTSRTTASSTCSTTSSTTPTRSTTKCCRDKATRGDVSLPFNYYPDDDPEKPPRCWRLRAPPVRQLDQRDVPDHALRAGADRGPWLRRRPPRSPPPRGTSSGRPVRRRAAGATPAPVRCRPRPGGRSPTPRRGAPT